MKRTITKYADELEEGEFVHVPEFVTAPDRVDPLQYVEHDLERKIVRLKAADREWTVRPMDMVKVVEA